MSLLGMANHIAAALLMMIGLYAVIAKNNLVKKIIGLAIFQSAIILFYVSHGYKANSAIPIVPVHASDEHQVVTGTAVQSVVQLSSSSFVNPVPHVLMLTAIVVGVATLGVALALCEKIFEMNGTLDETQLLDLLDDTQ
jgi:multicomponent Na+:H+ antiporter subunit C